MIKLRVSSCSLLLTCGFVFNLLFSANGFAQTADKKAVRVIALAPHIVEQLFFIGAGEQVIGTTAHSDYPDAAKQIPRIGNYANLQIEKILALAPDYIIAWKTGNPPQDLARLKRLGVPVMYSNPTTVDSVADELIFLGELTGHQAQAQQVANEYRVKLAQLKQTYANKTKVRVFYQLWKSPLTTIANKAWPLRLLNLCSIDNPFADAVGDYPQISMEHVLMAQPQMIIIPTSHAEPNGAIDDWTKYKQIKAVANKQVITVDSDQLHRMTPRALDELSVMCKKIDQARHFYAQSK